MIRPVGVRFSGLVPPASARRPDAVRWVCGVAAAATAVGCLLSAAVGVGDGARVVLGFAGGGLAVGGLAARSLRRHRFPGKVQPADAVVAVVAGWLVLVLCSTALYLVTGALDLGAALFESSSGYATTALSAVDDPGDLPRGVLFWRAWTQWSAGFGALLVAVIVIPFLGLGVLRHRAPGVAGGVLQPGSRRAVEIRRRLAATYLALTAVGVVAYLLGGLGPFDAVTYSFTTVSTGGFTNAPPLDAFDDARLQWAAIGGMLVAGAALTLVWRGVRAVRDEAVRSRELRTYLTVVAVGALVLTAAEHDGAALADRVRVGLFTAVSLVSTTGYVAEDWTPWGDVSQVVIVVLLAVGSMSGSPGGGFRILRARVLASYARAVITTEEHRAAAVPVTLGDTPVPGPLALRMVGYQVLWIGTAFVGAILLAATGLDALGAVSGSISALATVGPALGDLAPVDDASSLAGADLAVLGVLALVGRLGVYPALVAVPALRARRRGRGARSRRAGGRS